MPKTQPTQTKLIITHMKLKRLLPLPKSNRKTFTNFQFRFNSLNPFLGRLLRRKPSAMAVFTSFLLCFSLSAMLLASAAVSPPLQLLSLLAIKSSLLDPLDTFRDWNLTSPGSDLARPEWCSWSGVECDRRTNQVVGLELSWRNLSGEIPADVGHLYSMRSLNLSNNSFSGEFPAVVFGLANLTALDVNHNLFNSGFPSGVSNLKSLEYFNAYSNSFTGPLPEELGRLENLEYLNLGGSYFSGEIPSSYGNLHKLKSLYLSGNHLTGRIPAQLGSLSHLDHFELGYNSFIGGIPSQFSGLSSLRYLDISRANLSGNLPGELGELKHLETLFLFDNNLSGSIPASWARMGSLQNLDLSNNKLSGEIPNGFSGLRMLRSLSLMKNELTGKIPEAIGELPFLEVLYLWNNSLSGILPPKLGSNAKLQMLDVSSNYLSGPIPPNLCLSNSLVKLVLFSNELVGPIPASIANCTALHRVRIQNNNLNGSIPLGFGLLPNLSYFELSKNRFTGLIPKDLGNAPSLELINVSGNAFGSELPENIWASPRLQIFSARSADIIGRIPGFLGCGGIYMIEIDGNGLNGSIPLDIGHCEKLITLDMKRNALTGIIPSEISSLPSITDLDLSHNFLTGEIPLSFNNCTTLENFNVSYNHLTGPIPESGVVFSSLHSSSFIGNDGLCGIVLKKPCKIAEEPSASTINVNKTTGTIIWIVAAAFVIGLFVIIMGIHCFQVKHNQSEISQWKLTAFQRLNFTADDVLESLKTTNKTLGTGSTATVYKAEMPGGEIIAVKRLWGKNVWRKGVLAEVEVLGNIRHRNIVRLLGCCSNDQCTMLLYEYMPNGSLEDMLHGKNKVFDWFTRYKIAVGVAQGICYLHHDCDPVIVHRDLKPSNILLDSEMEARVADFGVAKLIQSHESMMSVIAGSYGYIAPEYAYTLQVDEKSDVYSYGVVLMEILTGKRSVEVEFGDGNSIVEWVRSRKSDMSDLLDRGLCDEVRKEMMVLFRVALMCTSRNPADRPSMRGVLSMLQEAKPVRKLARCSCEGASDGDCLDFEVLVKKQ